MSPTRPILSSTSAGIIGAIACTAIFALTIGLSYPLLSFVLKSNGYDDAAIGFNAAMTPLGVLVASPFYPRLIARFGAWRVAAFCLVGAASMILLLGMTQLFAAFLVLRFLLGVFDVGVYIVSETWINQLASDRTRGRVVGLYATALSAGFGSGPLILALTGSEGVLPFVIGSSVCLLAVAVVVLIRHAVPDTRQERAVSSLKFLRLAPALLLSIVAFAFWDAALLALFPVYGLDYGLDASFVAIALSVCIFGNTFLQIPIGWLADKTQRRDVLILCCGVAALGALLLPVLVGNKVLLLPMLFVWGAAAGGIYTMAMTELGDRFSGAELVAGNAAFALAYGVGGIIGGPFVGLAMKAFGSVGYSGSMAVVLLAVGLFALIRRQMSAPEH